jgi:predicted Zn-dependent protease with MMP-like domain
MNSPADWSAALAPSLDDFAALADQAYAALPDEFRKMVGDVVFQVAEFADEDVLEEFGIEDPFELTGLYQGVSLAHRSLFDPAPSAAMVFLYRRPILDEWAARGDLPLGELIGHVLVHEIGHHFGLSDDDIHAIEAG